MMRFSYIATLLSSATLAAGADCTSSSQHISQPPYENYFFSDCHSSSHVIVTSPTGSTSSTLEPRLLIAWPAGNSGIAAYFSPENGQTGSLGIHLENGTASGQALESVSEDGGSENSNPRVGISGLIHFDSPAILTLPILGSIRAIRDYSEGGGNLHPEMQNAVQEVGHDDGSATIYRTWFDGKTTTWLDFAPSGSVDAVKVIPGDKYTLRFGQGTYTFRATFNYLQLDQLSPPEVLNANSSGLVSQSPDQTTSLSFLSYKEKLLAGSWRFLTYFGRDTMISALLMRSVLSEGQGGAVEATIAAVLERVNKTDGTVCHEEVIGDYASWVNKQNGIDSAAPSCDYKMVDTDYYLPVLMKDYFVDSETGSSRTDDFLNTKASFLQENSGSTYRGINQAVAEKIMRTSAPFYASQTIDNLIHLKDGQSVGEWRDSNNGLGGGRIPYDVNTALVPAGLRAIGALARQGIFDGHDDWKTLADEYAQVWEDKTLDFFKVTVPQATARQLVENYTTQATYYGGPSNSDDITADVTFYGLSLNGDNNQPIVRVMNTDDCFRHFLLDTTNQTQLSDYLEQTASNILAPFPVGLSTAAGLLVANPAYGGSQQYTDNWSNSQYHGTVIWSWQLSMMAAGLQRQLDRCRRDGKPNFCNNDQLHSKIVSAYYHLWDLIDANRAELSGEVWSWKYDGGIKAVPFSTYSSTESDIVQLWSLTFLAVKKDTSY